MEKYIILNIVNANPSNVTLIDQILSDYQPIRLENSYIIACDKSAKDKISLRLVNGNIHFTLIYVNTKFGGDVLLNGIDLGTSNSIKKIILYK